MTTLTELLDVQTEDELVTSLLADLGALGLPVTAWQSGGAARTLVRADARALADLHAAVALVAKAGFLDDAEGDWLTLHAKSRFDIVRTAATFEAWDVVVTVLAGSGPYTITAGGLVVSDGTRFYRSTNTANILLTSAATTTVRVRAELAGTAGHTLAGSITTLVAPAWAGVTVTNPGVPAVSGVDAELDASLRQRCRDRWAALGRGANAAAYRYWARTGHAHEAQVTRAEVVWGPGDGTLTVYLAGPDGPIADAAIVTAVRDWILANHPGTDNPTVASVAGVAVTLTATIRVRATDDSAANRARATDALAAYIRGLGIGDDVDLGRLYEALYRAAGVLDADIASPTGDVSVSNGQVATLTLALTWTAV